MLHKVNGADYASITVDVFDTLLMRKVWPEDLQFLAVAELWTLLFSNIAGIEVTSYELYTYRRDCRRILQHAQCISRTSIDNGIGSTIDGTDHQELGIEKWFKSIIDAVADRYNIHLESLQKSELLDKLIEAELSTECENLIVNDKVVSFLVNAKKDNPNIKILFVSDMYLKSEHIKMLLKYFEIYQIFDGGFSSADMSRSKWSGKIYHYLNNNHIQPGNNLHIGDNLHSDVKMARLFGSDSIHFNPLRNIFHRRVMTLLGRRRLENIISQNRQNIKNQYNESMSRLIDNNSKHLVSRRAKSIGYTFGTPLFAYLSEVTWLSSLGEIPAISVSSESRTFQKLLPKVSPKLHNSDYLKFMPKLNRRSALIGLLDSIIRSRAGKYSSRNLANVLRLGEGLSANSSIYNFILGEDTLGGPDIVIDQLQDDRLGKLISEISMSDDSERTVVARKLTKEFVKSLKINNAIILDVGWNGTIQALLQQTLLTLNKDVKLHGVYVGARTKTYVSHLQKGDVTGWLYKDISKNPDHKIFVPEIWEFILTGKDYSTGLQSLVQSGLETSIDYLSQNNIHASPMEIFLATKPMIASLLNNPNREDVKLMGLIKFDSGFVNTAYVPLVDTSISSFRVLAKLLIKPRQSLKSMTQQYCWTAGFLKYHRISWIARPMLKLAGKKLHKDFI